jgi:ankyrin repeat protein
MRKGILLLTMLSFYVVHAGDGRRLLYDCITMGEDDLWTLTEAAGFVACLPEVSGTADLHRAAKSGDIDSVRKLLDQVFVDINVQNDDGDTPLHYAAYHGRVDIMRELLAHRADVKVCNRAKNTSLHHAAVNGNEDITRELLAHGADEKAQNEHGFTPADLAELRGCYNLARLIRHWNDSRDN